jgi:hypothetical protein
VCLIGRAFGQASLPVDFGETVHTFEAANSLGGVVVTLVDTTPSGLTNATKGSNFLPSICWNAGGGADSWTLANLGQVYGVTLDGASSPNIYVTAASSGGTAPIYNRTESGGVYGPLGPGGVYRLDGVTGAICHVVTLPNDADSALGNITYSRTTNSLYISNFADGLIYRVGLGPNRDAPNCPATVSGTYNHGSDGRPAEVLSPIHDDGLPGLTKRGRRVWGLAVHPGENRLYYGVWWENTTAANPTESNEVWSVALDPAGDPIPLTANREFLHPNLFSYSNPAAGLNFTRAGSLLVAERTVGADHQSRLLEYTGSTGAWVGQPVSKYLVGVGNTSCSGAGAEDGAGNVWTAGDGLTLNANNFLYGMMRIPSGGNTAHAPSYGQSILIDSDQDISSGDKTQIGSLVHRPRVCTPAPDGLTSWLTLDDGDGDFFGDSANPERSLGRHVNYPPVSAGMVGLTRCYNGVDQYSTIPSSAATNVGAGSFTVDAWVKWQGGLGVRTIVDKRGPGGGYAFFVQGSVGGNGQLFAQVYRTLSYNQNVASGFTLPLNQWVFVSMSVARPSQTQQTVTFCVGNPAAGTFQSSNPVALTTNVWGTLDNASPLTIGVRSAALGGGAYFTGCIDEVEFFTHALAPAELQRIFDARELGKCRTACTLPPWTFFRGSTYPLFVSADASLATIRNYDPFGAGVFTYGFQAFPVTIKGPSSFASTPLSPLAVPGPGVTSLTTLTLGKPTNMTQNWQVGGYTMTAQNTADGKQCTCEGRVMSVPRFHWNLPARAVVIRDLPQPIPGFGFTNEEPAGFDRRWIISVIGPDGRPDARTVGINGMAPGITLQGEFSVAPGGQVTFPGLTVQFANASPNSSYYLQVQMETGDGNDEYAPIAIVPLVSLLEAPPCPADFNGDGTVDFFDYLDFAAALDGEDPAADFNGDQVVDFFDYLDFVAAFDVGCD